MTPSSSSHRISYWKLAGTFLCALCFYGSVFCVSIAEAKSAEENALEFSPASKNVTVRILNELAANHYQKILVDDHFSQMLLDHYLDTLDPARTIFIASDIQEFGKFSTQLDDMLKTGNLDAAQQIFSRFRQRSLDLVSYSLANMEHYDTPYAGKDPEIELDRENAPWPASLKESQDLWDKRIYNEVLLLKLSNGKARKEPMIDTLRKRYENRRRKLQEMTAEEIFDVFINTAMDLYDPHTEWFDPRTEENFKINMSLSLEGIGAVLQQEEEKTKIIRLVTGGPAAKSGALHSGDYILAVGQGKNGEMVDISGQRIDEVVQKIRGPKGSVVRLEIESASNQVIKQVSIEREQVKLEDQAAKSAVIEHADGAPEGKKIGIINVPAFYMDFDAYKRGDENYRSTTRDVEKLLGNLIENKVDGVIIDLRNNGGGSLQEARLLCNLFISQGPIVQIRSANNMIDRSLRADQDPVYLGPLLIVTNHLSASASEIFAGAIQDYQRGLVVGEQTFGKGTVQTIADLDYGQLKYTNAKFYRVSGESTQFRGVIPDIEIPSLFDFDEVGESALDHALPWDSIHETAHIHYNEIKPYLKKLGILHEQRMEASPDYQLLLQRIDHRKKLKSIKTISIREDTRRKQRDEDDAWLLQVTNEMRQHKGLPAFKTIDDLEKYEEEKSAQWNGATLIDLEDDFLLREDALILNDFIVMKLNENGSTVAVGR